MRRVLFVCNHNAGRIDEHLDVIRSDRTAHELRLGRLLPGLARDFEATRSPEEIRACTDAVLSAFDDAPIRSFVPALAHRRTSECLRRDVRDLVGAAKR